MKQLLRLALLFLLISCGGCALLTPAFETPTVSVTSFRVLPGDSVVPTFEIGLHVVNPNRAALKLAGLSYQAELEGHRILSGATSRLPVIAGYGEGDIVLQAKPDLFNTIGLFHDFLKQPRDSFKFNLEALLDVGGLVPKIRVSKEGFIDLAEAAK